MRIHRIEVFPRRRIVPDYQSMESLFRRAIGLSSRRMADEDVEKIAREPETIALDNATLFDFHRARRTELATE
jgi:hypothetical protein